MKCNRCGAKARRKDNFCGECGKSLAAEQAKRKQGTRNLVAALVGVIALFVMPLLFIGTAALAAIIGVIFNHK